MLRCENASYIICHATQQIEHAHAASQEAGECLRRECNERGAAVEGRSNCAAVVSTLLSSTASSLMHQFTNIPTMHVLDVSCCQTYHADDWSQFSCTVHAGYTRLHFSVCGGLRGGNLRPRSVFRSGVLRNCAFIDANHRDAVVSRRGEWFELGGGGACAQPRPEAALTAIGAHDVQHALYAITHLNKSPEHPCFQHECHSFVRMQVFLQLTPRLISSAAYDITVQQAVTLYYTHWTCLAPRQLIKQYVSFVAAPSDWRER